MNVSSCRAPYNQEWKIGIKSFTAIIFVTTFQAPTIVLADLNLLSATTAILVLVIFYCLQLYTQLLMLDIASNCIALTIHSL